MTIGLTDNLGSEKKLDLYKDWIGRGPGGCAIRILSYKSDNAGELQNCDALVLSGGNDVDPSLYGGPVGHPGITGIDRRRDDFENDLLDRALQKGIPVLGICRGMQLVNVHFGGTILPDIEEAGYPAHKSPDDGTVCVHRVIVEKGSLLGEITGRREGIVNSSHHQAVGTPGKGLKISARAADGIVEAMEFDESMKSRALLLIQWHPERVRDVNDPFSQRLLDFLYNENNR